ncbi:class I SAM-dependent methyltransferase [Halocatena pleomorpha]|uniref:Class I SAM-dependent methyltransferase n=1 Tax=Halocatena pleomorpha TaxID=1785090 RepID=A0A3P3R384_9EURY|nr:class I SAM-dependent methyltransferase [Halocatena pleomorpha]RRJ27931.1 class I SAM-dependent methyltransferase [Halocatena pleomorpha]
MDDRNHVRRAYDEITESYAEHRTADGHARERLEGFLDRLPETARVLDAGCGHGTPILDRLACETEAIGVEFSRGQVEVATENAPTASLLQGDMTSLPVRDGTVDAVTAFHSLIHVPLNHHQRVLDEFARVLRPDGHLLFTEGTEAWQGENPNWLDSGVEMQWEIAGPTVTERQLRAAGFSLLDKCAVKSGLTDDEATFTLFLARLATSDT